ncbi:MAG: hypothetical protein WBE74_21445, partial [Terracidiphilus sp.]
LFLHVPYFSLFLFLLFLTSPRVREPPVRRAGGLKTPGSYFGSRTASEANAALESKFGPAKSSREGADTHFDAKNRRSYNVHTNPQHGDPHVDIRKRGLTPDRKVPLKKESQ